MGIQRALYVCYMSKLLKQSQNKKGKKMTTDNTHITECLLCDKDISLMHPNRKFCPECSAIYRKDRREQYRRIHQWQKDTRSRTKEEDREYYRVYRKLNAKALKVQRQIYWRTGIMPPIKVIRQLICEVK